MVFNKFTAMGYFEGVPSVSKGPWFKEKFVEDDGLEWYYTFTDSEGKPCYLLSNNMELKDRESVASLYKSMNRINKISWFFGLWVGFEAVRLDSYFRKMALGWRGLSMLGIAWVFNGLATGHYAQSYNPLFSAYLRKYKNYIKNDPYEIKDQKRAYFYIDTSQYMNYTNEDTPDEHHVHHGPQPEGDAHDSSYLVEMDKFLRGEENNFRGHKKFYDYNFEFKDKSFPSAEKVADLMHKKD